jgi:hypothetical protein
MYKYIFRAKHLQTLLRCPFSQQLELQHHNKSFISSVDAEGE